MIVNLSTLLLLNQGASASNDGAALEGGGVSQGSIKSGGKFEHGCGSAITHSGIREILCGIREILFYPAWLPDARHWPNRKSQGDICQRPCHCPAKSACRPGHEAKHVS